MSKETISQTEGLCKEVATCIRNAYDRGYKQGFKDGNYDKEFFCNLNFEHGTNKGLDDAWQCMKKAAFRETEGGIPVADLKEMFGGSWLLTEMLRNYSANEVIAKIKEYEEKQKAEDTDSEIKTGDEVIYDNKKGIACGEPFPVGIDEELFVDVWFGSCMIRTMLKYVKKTGKHYYHVPEILKQLKGER